MTSGGDTQESHRSRISGSVLGGFVSNCKETVRLISCIAWRESLEGGLDQIEIPLPPLEVSTNTAGCGRKCNFEHSNEALLVTKMSMASTSIIRGDKQ